MADIVDGGGPASVFPDTLDGGNPATVYPPALTPLPEGRPVPSVQIIVADVKPGTAAVDVYRIADGRTTLVRGGIRKSAIGGTTLVDWEAPFGVPIQYRAEQFDETDTSLGFTETSTTLDVADTWIHQPLNPSVAVSPLRLSKTAGDVARSTPGELVYVQGAEFATRIGGQRRGVAAVPFELLTRSLADADRLQAVFGRYGSRGAGVVCIRTPPPMRLPRTFYASVDEVHEVPVNIQIGREDITFTFEATEARPPAPGLVTAVLRRKDIDAAYPTRAARAAAYATRLERDSDYSLAGVADA
ncbi:hypothetical protein HUN58_14675 [Curtobacterium sp. Csp1]|uniref:hypothetical protein n=1 Tax=Curtobacterium sp. Csp1 TaxID=2495429 RepID=UPI00159B690D|nr:hypothetical protein [Curtobacterium sp. Csp1]QKS20998.1 hypothetical protein HUN58_14675 [Curtobacterium sp. Csp1]